MEFYTHRDFPVFDMYFNAQFPGNVKILSLEYVKVTKAIVFPKLPFKKTIKFIYA